LISIDEARSPFGQKLAPLRPQYQKPPKKLALTLRSQIRQNGTNEPRPTKTNRFAMTNPVLMDVFAVFAACLITGAVVISAW
jgi:hypothetical protein